MEHDCNHKMRMPSCWNTKNIFLFYFFYSITVMFIFLLRVEPASILEKIFNLWDLWSLFVNLGNSEGPASSGCCGVNQCFRLSVLYSLVGSRYSEVVPLLKAVSSVCFQQTTEPGTGRAWVLFGHCYSPRNKHTSKE